MQKTDLQRLGIFKEQSYHTIDDPYVERAGEAFLKSLEGKFTGKPLYLAGGQSKLRAANSDGYFNAFQAGFLNEPYKNYNEVRRGWAREARAKRLNTKDWLPASGHRNRSGTGSTFGNFQEIHQAFDPLLKQRLPASPALKNFYTNPGKKGTGYGYTEVCLSPFPQWQPGNTSEAGGRQMVAEAKLQHLTKVAGRPTFVSTTYGPEPFDKNPWAEGDPLAPGGPPDLRLGITNFPTSMRIGPEFIPSSPAKLDGGMKDGTITPFPSYSSEPYANPITNIKIKEDKSKWAAGQWIPQSGTADVVPQSSVMAKNVDLAINSKTRHSRRKVWKGCD